MKNENPPIFNQSTQLDAPDEEARALHARRLSTYSVEALRAAQAVDKVFVMTPGALHGLKALDRLFQMGAEFEMQQGMRLVGPAGVGKTKLFAYFQASLPSSALFATDSAAIGIRVPQKPTTGFVVQAILNAIRYPFASGSRKQLYMRRFLLFEALKSCKTRLLWVDEAHHLMHARRDGSQGNAESSATEFLQELIDECPISLVLSGSEELDAIDKVAPYLASRVTTHEVLENFAADEVWIGFVRAFAKQCSTFDLGFLADASQCMRLHMATNGNMRDFKRLVTEAVLVAYDGGQRVLDLPALAIAFGLIFGRATTRSNPFV